MSPESTPAKNVGRFFRFRLWHLLVLVTIVVIGVGVYAELERRVARQQAAIAVVESFGWVVEKEAFGPGWLPVRYRTYVVGLKSGEGHPDPFSADDDPFNAGIDEITTRTLHRYQYDESTFERSYVTKPRPSARELLLSLRKFPSLQRLSLGGHLVRDEHVELFDPDWPLTSLDLTSHVLTDVGMAKIGKYEQLTLLDLSHSHVQDTDLPHLTRLKKLIRLDLSRTNVSDDGLVHLRSHTLLRELDLSQTSVRGKGLAQLGSLVHLETLRFYCSKLNRVSTLQYPGYYFEYGNIDLTELPTFPALQTLEVHESRLGRNDFASIARQPELTRLDVSFCEFARDSLEPLGDSAIQHVDISHTPHTIDDLRDLMKIRVLRTLVEAEVSSKQLNVLADLIAEAPCLEHFTVELRGYSKAPRGYSSNNDDCKRLIDAICDSPQLTTVELKGFNLLPQDISRINANPKRNPITASGELKR